MQGFFVFACPQRALFCWGFPLLLRLSLFQLWLAAALAPSRERSPVASPLLRGLDCLRPFVSFVSDAPEGLADFSSPFTLGVSMAASALTLFQLCLAPLLHFFSRTLRLLHGLYDQWFSRRTLVYHRLILLLYQPPFLFQFLHFYPIDLLRRQPGGLDRFCHWRITRPFWVLYRACRCLSSRSRTGFL